MISAVIDQIEGHFAVIQATAEDGIVTIDALLTNLPDKVAEGDLIEIYRVDHIDLEDDSRCVYKDLSKKEVLKKFLQPLGRPVDTLILLNEQKTQERSQQMKNLISNLFQ